MLSWAYPQADHPPQRPASSSKTRQAGKHSKASAYGDSVTPSGMRMLGAIFAILTLGLHSICEGWTVALAVADGTDVSTVLVPLCLTGALKAAAVSILAALVYKQTTMRAVTAGSFIALLAPMAALLRLARVPLGSALPVPYEVDASGVTSKAVAVTAGAMLTLGIQVLTPMATKLHRQAGLKGLFSGLACGLLVFGLRGVLCILSSACLHVR